MSSRVSRVGILGAFRGQSKTDKLTSQASSYAVRTVSRKHELPVSFDDDKWVAEFLRAQFPKADKRDPDCDCYRCLHTETKLTDRCKCPPCRDYRNILRWGVV